MPDPHQPRSIETDPKRRHSMIPGSHERPSGPECRCGAAWSRWQDRCVTQLAPEPQGQPRTHDEWKAWYLSLRQRPYSESDIADCVADMGQQVMFLHDVRTYLLAALKEVTDPGAEDFEPGDEDTADMLVSSRHLLKLSGLTDHE